MGPLGIPDQPSEKEFISCLRNGILLCNMINKIQPGSVQKVITNQMANVSIVIRASTDFHFFLSFDLQ